MRILLSAALLLLPAAAAAQAPIGLFTELAVETKVDLLAWPESCGRLPVASRIPGRGQVSVDVRGGVLTLRAKKAPVLIRSDVCSDPDAGMTRSTPVHEENRWELFCSTPAGSSGARSETLKIVFTPPDGLSTSLVTRWGSECKGTEAVTRVFTRTVPTAAEPVAQPVPEEAPDAGEPIEEVVVVAGEEDGGVALAAAPGGSRSTAGSRPPEETVVLPDVELAAPDDEGGYLLPVRELQRKGSLLPLLLGAGLLLVAAVAAGGLLLRKRRPAARVRAAEPSAAGVPAGPQPEGPPPPQPVDDPRADLTAPMTAAVVPGPPSSVQVDPALGATVVDPRSADTLEMRSSAVRRLDASEREALGRPRFCPACGKQVPAGARFCPHCRSKMPGGAGKG